LVKRHGERAERKTTAVQHLIVSPWLNIVADMDPGNASPPTRVRTVLTLMALLAGTFLPGCASSSPPKLDSTKVADFAVPGSGKAKVIFFNPDKNSGIDVGVHDGEQLVAKLRGKSYCVYECEAGKHVFSGSFGNLDIVDAELLANRIYYVKGGMVVQMFGPAWVKMVPLHPDSPRKEWDEMLKTLPRLDKSIVTPEQVEHDRRGIERYMERFKAYREKPGAVFETVQPEYGQTTSVFSP
jgi:hypothetical protein